MVCCLPSKQIPILTSTTRENPSSSACFIASSSAGTSATTKALQLTSSSSARKGALLLYLVSSSTLLWTALPLLVLKSAAAKFSCIFKNTAYFHCVVLHTVLSSYDFMTMITYYI